MAEIDKPSSGEPDEGTGDGNGPGIDSKFRLILVAAQRSKQLQRGARPLVVADPKRRRNTSIALEEVRLGLVHFIITDEDQKGDDGGRRNQDERIGSGEDQTDLRSRVA